METSAALAAAREECIQRARDNDRDCVAKKCVQSSGCTEGGGAPAPAQAPARAMLKVASQSLSALDQASALLAAIQARLISIGDRPPTTAELAELRNLLDQVKTITGPDPTAFWDAGVAAAKARAAANDLFSWGAPAYPIYRAGFSTRSTFRPVLLDEPKLTVAETFLRGPTEPYGQYQVFLRNGAAGSFNQVWIENWFYDHRTRSVGHSTFGPSDAGVLAGRYLRSFTLVPLRARPGETTPLLDQFADGLLRNFTAENNQSTLRRLKEAEVLVDQINDAIARLDGRDTDNDGLPDIAEFIVETNRGQE